MTGAKVYIANLSNLSLPTLEVKCKNHLLINISFALIKCFCLLLGSSIDSFAFIGKLEVCQSSIKKNSINQALQHDNIINNNSEPKGLDTKTFESLDLVVHKGPMLIAPGTILQNHKVKVLQAH